MEIAKNDPRSDTRVKDTKNNKRKLTVSCNDDSYFNLRLFLRQLRSHFIQGSIYFGRANWVSMDKDSDF
ncbi:hypothetical protein ES319_A09G042400v1 [Gossypium barbadense]|uniref:Uncharacterized protein n=1 Tax=Gossypium barbadense TaxID=3634 RepID=A0A5J5UB39_GOSBA|nr:hypothetical protein ES319_A09G042400v1 [Gossypium barbadense]